MPTKLDAMKKLWNAGDHRGALKLAASWHRLGEHRNAIKGGWAAKWNPGFYRQLGKDPVVMYEAGLAALVERYELKPTKETTT